MDKRKHFKDALTTSQITHILRSCKVTRHNFKGVFALDELPKTRIKRRPAIVVCNTAYSDSSGEHWVGFFLANDKIEYFDSYGLPPNSIHFNQFIQKNSNLEIVYNKFPLQGVSAETCGKYVCTYMYYRSLGYSNSQYINLFTKKNPDSFVRLLFRKLFRNWSRGCNRIGQKCYKYGEDIQCVSIQK